MSVSTTNLELSTLNRSTESATTLVGTWIDSINDVNGSNMTKIDAFAGKILKEGTNFTTELLADGTLDTFTITHNRNNASPAVSVISGETNKPIEPDVEILNKNQLKIIFLTPPSTGKKYFVTIS